jgi:hypothetical protein
MLRTPMSCRRAHGVAGGERLQHGEEGAFGSFEVAHVVPQRVVGIEADQVDWHAGTIAWRPARLDT